ncbi:Biopolymer transport protein ExbD/TolR [Lysobacter dokdonensis DS-58]|uniref:Biopolymer transport protein ExbD/TolR n=1 Tax=Lysobacter dokdonensis DS-58 TaxID=1300345 RepID=A0A0A2WQI1_9GAMM|nr:biopolymer transporter ExbD [Lysobacter dokdonensis]KGQ20545.1 Biopolymer transport protein ExbD/TolR [Lysobacter dokdonensis DS-58]
MAVSAFAQSSNDRDFADINITPLVDVLLVLLIIFMVAAPAVTKAVDFTLPQVSPPSPIKPQRITLDIRGDGSVAWNGAAVPLSGLRSLMEVEAQRDPAHPPMLVIDASGDADYGLVTRVLADAHSAQMKNISFVQ